MSLKHDGSMPRSATLVFSVMALTIWVDHSGAMAADGEIKPGPPGVIIEPIRPRQDGPKGTPAPDADVREPPAPGCPANDRKLELLV